MNNLEHEMKVVLANAFTFYLKAHYFHWNVEGQNFTSLHSFFGNIYDEVFESIDVIAEHIRALDMYAPGSMERFKELSEIHEQIMVPRAEMMVDELAQDNEILIDSLKRAYLLSSDHLGLQNFLQDRIAAHEKHGWMLRATSKKHRG